MDIPLDFKLSDAQQFAVSDLILSSVDGLSLSMQPSHKKECRITRLTILTRLCLLMLRNGFCVLCTQQDTLYKGKRYSILMTMSKLRVDYGADKRTT
uniref:Uncharacterized protein n=1 Tax=Salmonella sp. TaxID=599 RepID=A0A482ETK4_SALSP|nr:hypothetical protein NNIBIDOC_00217 [Salmonella sp.]